MTTNLSLIVFGVYLVLARMENVHLAFGTDHCGIRSLLTPKKKQRWQPHKQMIARYYNKNNKKNSCHSLKIWDVKMFLFTLIFGLFF